MSTPLTRADSFPKPSSTETAFILGPDTHGHWVAVEVHGLGGGLFRTRQAAADYAASETGRRPGAVLLSESPIELRL